MKNPHRAKAFRDAVRSRGLLTRTEGNLDQKLFVLEFSGDNQFPVEGNPRRILELIKLARDYAVSRDDGEHNNFLKLYTKKSDLRTRPTVVWTTYFETGRDYDNWISLDEYLQEHGINVEAEVLGKNYWDKEFQAVQKKLEPVFSRYLDDHLAEAYPEEKEH